MLMLETCYVDVDVAVAPLVSHLHYHGNTRVSSDHVQPGGYHTWNGSNNCH